MDNHSPSNIITSSSNYPYFTNFPPFNKSFYKPGDVERKKYNKKSKPKIRAETKLNLKKPTFNILRNIVKNFINLFKFKLLKPPFPKKNILENLGSGQNIQTHHLFNHAESNTTSNGFSQNGKIKLSQEFFFMLFGVGHNSATFSR